VHVGLAEDDPEQAALLSLWLQGGQHSVKSFSTLSSYVDALKREHFDLLLVDWMLPDGTGAEALDWIRQHLGWNIPVIVVTAREDEETVCTALRAGADDYVVKPPKPMELLARLQAVARRVSPGGLPVLRMGPFEIDISQQKLCVDTVPVTLTQKEFDLSVYLFQNPGKLLSRDHLLDKIWGIHADVDTRTVDTHISRLRKKLLLDGSRGWKLVPIYGYGYRFDRQD
jgi:two-component system response regulator RegX3